VEYLTGDYAASLVSGQEALSLNQETGDRPRHAWILTGLAAVHRSTGDGPAAAASISEALRDFRDIGRLDGQAVALNELGQVQAHSGDYQAAAESYLLALQLFSDSTDHYGHSQALINLAEVESLTGATNLARDHFGQALGIARRHGMPREEARALEGLGRNDLHDHNRGNAVAVLRKALAIYQRIGAPSGEGVRQLLDELASAPGSHSSPTPAQT
jgi:tetratricopeptide (TPR) repeat protein